MLTVNCQLEQCVFNRLRNSVVMRCRWMDDAVAATESCQLSCRPRRHRFFVHLAKVVVDGTRCHPDNPYRICIAGRCQVRLHNSPKPA